MNGKRVERRVIWVAAAAAVAMSAGCGSWSPWRGPTEQSRIPRDATVYQCAAGKVLGVRVEEGGKSAMVIFPEREFRLERLDENRYGNGRTVLQLDAQQAWIDDDGKRLYDACKRKEK